MLPKAHHQYLHPAANTFCMSGTALGQGIHTIAFAPVVSAFGSLCIIVQLTRVRFHDRVIKKGKGWNQDEKYFILGK